MSRENINIHFKAVLVIKRRTATNATKQDDNSLETLLKTGSLLVLEWKVIEKLAKDMYSQFVNMIVLLL